MKAILLIDHGSRRTEANEMLACMAALVQRLAADRAIVRHAHMELAEPTIEQGVAACVTAGATEVIAFPYMLSPGRHSTSDIPRLVADAGRAHPTVVFRVTPAFGIEAELGEVILRRAGVAADALADNDGCRCWHPEQRVGTCGDACSARGQAPWSTPPQAAEEARSAVR